MSRGLIVAIVLFTWSGSTFAVCKYKASDGSWTYATTCAAGSSKEINQSASMVLKKNRQTNAPGGKIEIRRLRGFEYPDTTHSGMRVPMVEPNKGPPEKPFTTQ